MSKTALGSLMQKKKITDLYVCGLAYDVCVGKQNGYYEWNTSNLLTQENI